MTKDNVTFAVFGIMLGFIAGYLMHEVMASRQPPRFAGNIPGGPAMAGGTGVTGPGPAEAPPQTMPAVEEMQQLDQHIRENPEDAQAVRRLADLNYDSRRWAQAEALYSYFLKLQPGDVTVLLDLGVVYRELKQYDRAIETFDQVLKIDPGHWQSMFNKAFILAIDMDELDEAQKVLDQLVKIQPGNPDVTRLAAEVEKRRNAA